MVALLCPMQRCAGTAKTRRVASKLTEDTTSIACFDFLLQDSIERINKRNSDDMAVDEAGSAPHPA